MKQMACTMMEQRFKNIISNTTCKKIILSTFFLTNILLHSFAQSYQYNQQSTKQRYALERLAEALKKDAGAKTFQLVFSTDTVKYGIEDFAISRTGNRITLAGGSDRAIIYAALSLAEDVRNGIPLKKSTAKKEKAFLPLRAIKYDLPWDSYRHSYALEQHNETCRDTAYWKTFLDMMVDNRFNSLTLWNLHPYTFLIKPTNFPEASPWTAAEMKAWQTLFHSIMRMAAERAVDVYIVPFNIFVTPEFSKAHNVAMDNLQHDYFVRGDTSEIIKRYTRECVTQMLEEYPEITGMGLTLGEGMAEMTPYQREDWMHETIIAGMRQVKRKTKLIHRIPFSSTTGSLGVTSIETEKLTRRSMEDEASMGFLEGPIWADLKFNWSHAHSTSTLIKVHGGKLYDTYFTPESDVYKIVWTARNEDFFCLRWGVPSFVRELITKNSHSWSGGFIIGSETYIPAKDYFTKDSLTIPWRYAFERQWLFYKLWGRLLYSPAANDKLFQQEFMRRYGKQGQNLLQASALAGAAALRIASDYDCGWDFTLYTEGMMARNPVTQSVEYISVDKLINQPPMDTSYISIRDFVHAVSIDSAIHKNKVTPLQLASMLEKDCNKALALVQPINVSAANNKALLYEVADIKAWAYLGLHFAKKIRGGLALQQFRIQGGETNKQEAIRQLQQSLGYWDDLVSITAPLYKKMPLVHLSQQGGKETPANFYNTFHWSDLRSEVAKDVQTAKDAKIK
jgi:hypothetical protein